METYKKMGRDCCSGKGKGTYGPSLWKATRKGKVDFFARTGLSTGNGMRVKF